MCTTSRTRVSPWSHRSVPSVSPSAPHGAPRASQQRSRPPRHTARGRSPARAPTRGARPAALWSAAQSAVDHAPTLPAAASARTSSLGVGQRGIGPAVRLRFPRRSPLASAHHSHRPDPLLCEPAPAPHLWPRRPPTTRPPVPSGAGSDHVASRALPDTASPIRSRSRVSVRSAARGSTLPRSRALASRPVLLRRPASVRAVSDALRAATVPRETRPSGVPTHPRHHALRIRRGSCMHAFRDRSSIGRAKSSVRGHALGPGCTRQRIRGRCVVQLADRRSAQAVAWRRSR